MRDFGVYGAHRLLWYLYEHDIAFIRVYTAPPTAAIKPIYRAYASNILPYTTSYITYIAAIQLIIYLKDPQLLHLIFLRMIWAVANNPFSLDQK